MTTHTHFKKLRVVLLLSFGLLLGLKSYGQNQIDFWQSFEKCTQDSVFQSHYPQLATGATRVHTLMNHGVSIPSMAGVTFAPNTTFEVLDKSAINAQQKTSFFLIHDANVTATDASFNMLYYYDYNGSYDTYVEATVTLSKGTGGWIVSGIVIK